MASDALNVVRNFAADRVVGLTTPIQLEHTMDNLAQCAYDVAWLLF